MSRRSPQVALSDVAATAGPIRGCVSRRAGDMRRSSPRLRSVRCGLFAALGAAKR